MVDTEQKTEINVSLGSLAIAGRPPGLDVEATTGGSGDEYQTPISFFKWAMDGIADVDLFADHHNALASNYFTKEHPCTMPEKLKGRECWANPPYSDPAIKKAMALIRDAVFFGAKVKALVRFDPSTDWWLRSVEGVADEVLMLGGRIKFRGIQKDGSAAAFYNFPSALVIYNGEGLAGFTNYRYQYLPMGVRQ